MVRLLFFFLFFLFTFFAAIFKKVTVAVVVVVEFFATGGFRMGDHISRGETVTQSKLTAALRKEPVMVLQRFKMVSTAVQEVIDQDANLYELIGFTKEEVEDLYLDPSCIPMNDIKTASERAQFKADPDRNGDHDGYVKVQKAAKILMNENDRDVYDYWYRRRFILDDIPGLGQHAQDIKLLEQETLSNVQEYDEMLRKLRDFKVPYGNWSLNYVDKVKQGLSDTDDRPNKKVDNEYLYERTGTLNMILAGAQVKLIDFCNRKDFRQIIAKIFHIEEDDIVTVYRFWRTKEYYNSFRLELKLWDPLKAQAIFWKYKREGTVIKVGKNMQIHSFTSCVSPDYYRRFKLPETKLNSEILQAINSQAD